MVEVIANVKAAKMEVLKYSGGIFISYTYAPLVDKDNDFAFTAPLQIDTAWRWPKLYVQATGTLSNNGKAMKRISVYDFKEQTTTGHDFKNGHIVPHRHMFSSGYCLFFKAMNWAEGYQNYRLDDTSAIADEKTVPECFDLGDYKIIGEVVVDEERSLHISGPDDDIWLALDKNFLVHRREQRFPDGTPKRKASIKSYFQISENSPLFFPNEMVVQDFTPSNFDAAGKMLFEARLQITRHEAGNVNQELFKVVFPDGIHVSDLIHDRHYYVGRKLDDVVPNPFGRNRLLIILNFIAFVIVGILLAFRRIWRSPSK